MLSNQSSEYPMNGGRTMPEPEVTLKASRRQFSAEYKKRILAEADRCREPGEIGELLRREGLYSSHLTTWRRQREDRGVTGLAGQKRGRKKDEAAAEMAKLQRENERLRKQLDQAELIIGAQKKLTEALATLTQQPDGSS